MERYEHDPMSPAGQVDGWGDLAAGLKYNKSGRRRALRMLAALALLLAAVTAVVFLIG